MKLVNLQNNIVFVFSENIASFLKTDPIELKISSIFSEKSPKPIVTKLPNQVVIFIPEVQFSIVASGATIAIADQTISEFIKKSSDKLLNLSSSIVKDIFKKTTSYYGYNFTYDLEDLEKSIAKSKIESHFFKENSLPASAEKTFLIPSYSFSDNGLNITINFDYQYKNISRSDYVIRVNVNVHFAGDVPELVELDKNYKKAETYVSEHIESIFK